MDQEKTNPRAEIEKLIGAGNLRELMERAALMHGHYCPGLASGVKAARAGMTRSGLLESEGMEKVMADVECNNCFVDGIQLVTGCTLGNNALIYRDLGVTAVTLYRRGDGTGLRVRVKELTPGTGLSDRETQQARELFEKSVKQRRDLDQEETRRFRTLWRKSAYALLDLPEDDLLSFETVEVAEPPYAPIHDSVTCARCGETVMESRARLRRGDILCLRCAGEQHGMVDGSGIDVSG